MERMPPAGVADAKLRAAIAPCAHWRRRARRRWPPCSTFGTARRLTRCSPSSIAGARSAKSNVIASLPRWSRALGQADRDHSLPAPGPAFSAMAHSVGGEGEQSRRALGIVDGEIALAVRLEQYDPHR